MLSRRKRGYAAAILAACALTVNAGGLAVFSVPDSLLLFGTYDELRLVTPDHAEAIKPPTELAANHGYFGYPSISPRGDLIAWGFATQVQNDRAEHRARFALGLYSVAAHKWKTFGDFDDVGNPVFSPDGSKIAFLAEEQKKKDLLILDVANGVMTKASYLNGIQQKIASLRSWSPEGKRFALEIQRGEKNLVAVLDLDTRHVQSLGEGFNPAWSPSGEWIAYFDPDGAKCLLVHPDGTGTKTVRRVRQSTLSYRRFGWGGPVWSPDGKRMLLSEMKGDGEYIDIVLLDIENGRVATKARNGLPVFGWASPQK
jgi:WD40-like Beta Propeller Repeat